MKSGRLPDACCVAFPHLKKGKKVQSVEGEEEAECNFIDLGVLEVSDDMPTMIEDELDETKDTCGSELGDTRGPVSPGILAKPGAACPGYVRAQ